ncbi:MAG: ABC transporter permease [Deltaproteobacteria bacterium]|nr:ABC transporter permease [Deltaproteobacteria bacterium]
MKKYIFNRIIQALFCVVLITIIVFSLTRISGDPVLLMVPPEATKEDIEEMREVLGLKKPIYIQYWKFISKAVQGDFGRSLRWNVPCLSLFWERFPNTLLLGSAAMAFAVIVGIPVGIFSSIMVGRWFDNFGKIFALLGQALPVFWLGIMLMIVFAVWLGLLPTSGMGTWKHLLMPTVTLGWYFTASLTRLTRSAMLDVLDMEYIKMARIMGVPGYMVVWKQALKNAFIPILTLGAVNFIILLNGTVITETGLADWLWMPFSPGIFP